MRETPHALGFRMPAEWEAHEATWIAWPHNRTDWPGRFPPIPWVFAEIVRKLASVERVRILVQDQALENQARRMLEKVGANLDAVEFVQRETDRAWTRDYCPLFVKNAAGETAITADGFASSNPTSCDSASEHASRSSPKRNFTYSPRDSERHQFQFETIPRFWECRTACPNSCAQITLWIALGRSLLIVMLC